MTDPIQVFRVFSTLITDDFEGMSPREIEQEYLQFLEMAIPLYEFPEKEIKLKYKKEKIHGEEVITCFFTEDLSQEDINILAYEMAKLWYQQQISTIELTRQKYTSSDFKQTSQAAHLKQLLSAQERIIIEANRLQKLATRRQNGKTTFHRLIGGKV